MGQPIPTRSYGDGTQKKFRGSCLTDAALGRVHSIAKFRTQTGKLLEKLNLIPVRPRLLVIRTDLQTHIPRFSAIRSQLSGMVPCSTLLPVNRFWLGPLTDALKEPAGEVRFDRNCIRGGSFPLSPDGAFTREVKSWFVCSLHSRMLNSRIFFLSFRKSTCLEMNLTNRPSIFHASGGHLLAPAATTPTGGPGTVPN